MHRLFMLLSATVVCAACNGGKTGDYNGGTPAGGAAAAPGQSGGGTTAATTPATPNAAPTATPNATPNVAPPAGTMRTAPESAKKKPTKANRIPRQRDTLTHNP